MIPFLSSTLITYSLFFWIIFNSILYPCSLASIIFCFTISFPFFDALSLACCCYCGSVLCVVGWIDDDAWAFHELFECIMLRLLRMEPRYSVAVTEKHKGIVISTFIVIRSSIIVECKCWRRKCKWAREGKSFSDVRRAWWWWKIRMILGAKETLAWKRMIRLSPNSCGCQPAAKSFVITKIRSLCSSTHAHRQSRSTRDDN